MTDRINLFNGMTAKYNSDYKAFMFKAEWEKTLIDFYLVTDPEDDNGVGAMEYSFKELYGDRERWEKELRRAFKHELARFLKIDESSIDVYDSLIIPDNILIMHTGNVQLFRPEGSRVEITYKVIHGQDRDSDFTKYSIAGSLERGFMEFYASGMAIDPALELEPYTLSTGVEIEYDPLLGAYSDTVPVGESIVDAIWVPNEEMTDCKPAFDLFEMLYPTIEDMQQIALIKIKDELMKNLENLRKFYSLPDLNASDIIRNLLFEVMIFETTGEFEFSFESTDPICLRISASGTYESPFSKIIIENTEDEEI